MNRIAQQPNAKQKPGSTPPKRPVAIMSATQFVASAHFGQAFPGQPFGHDPYEPGLRPVDLIRASTVARFIASKGPRSCEARLTATPRFTLRSSRLAYFFTVPWLGLCWPNDELNPDEA